MAKRVISVPLARSKFQSLKGFQRFCGFRSDIPHWWIKSQVVSIPKRVSEVLWRVAMLTHSPKYRHWLFQSLKGFQRFCGAIAANKPKPVPMFQSLKGFQRFCGSAMTNNNCNKKRFQSLKGFQRFCG